MCLSVLVITLKVMHRCLCNFFLWVGADQKEGLSNFGKDLDHTWGYKNPEYTKIHFQCIFNDILVDVSSERMKRSS